VKLYKKNTNNNMNKKTKMYVGVAVVAVAAYYFYMQSKKKETTTPSAAKFVGADGRRKAGSPCQYIEGGYLYSGRISSYGKNICQGSSITSRGEAL
jgi:hypothetical protein